MQGGKVEEKIVYRTSLAKPSQSSHLKLETHKTTSRSTNPNGSRKLTAKKGNLKSKNAHRAHENQRWCQLDRSQNQNACEIV